jgi:hypothetical protein
MDIYRKISPYPLFSKESPKPSGFCKGRFGGIYELMLLLFLDNYLKVNV